MRPFASEQVAPKLAFELPDRPRQRRLCDMAFLGRAGKVQRPGTRQEVSDLVHFHSAFPTNPWRCNAIATALAARPTDAAKSISKLEHQAPLFESHLAANRSFDSPQLSRSSTNDISPRAQLGLYCLPTPATGARSGTGGAALGSQRCDRGNPCAPSAENIVVQ
jgi:hypothetical protein